MPNLVSIIIPCYNAERWIGAAIQSALDQTYRPVEVIVVDDGSTDRSLEVIKSFGRKIRWETGPNRGGNAARNRGLAMSHGEWLQYLDADDYLEPDKIARQMEFLALNPDMDIVFGPFTMEYWSEQGCRQELLPVPEPHDLWVLLGRWFLPGTGSGVWRKDTILDVGGWSEQQPCCQEHELYLRLLMTGKRFMYCPHGGYVYRQWGEQTVGKRDKTEVRRRRLEIKQRAEEFLLSRNQLTPARLWAINMGRFELARSAWQEDHSEALQIMNLIRRSQPGFLPAGPEAPPAYTRCFRLLGFQITQAIAECRRLFWAKPIASHTSIAPFGELSNERPQVVSDIKPSERPRLDTLTSLRFFAAIAVVLTHFGIKAIEGTPWWVTGFFKGGGQAVTFFFVLSGFILTYSYYDGKEDSGLKTSRENFWLARFARIYPVYALSLLIAILPYVYGAFVSHVTPMRRFIWGSVSVPLLLQSWLPSIAWEWNLPAWSLSVEAFFYALFPIMIGLWRKTHLTTRTFLLAGFAFLVLVTALECSFPTYAMDLDRARPSDLYMLLHTFPPLHLPCFVVGMGLGKMFLKDDPWNSHWSTMLFLTASVLFFGLLAMNGRLPPIAASNLISVPLFAVMILFAPKSRGFIRNILSHPWLVLLGEASYGIYILHVPLSFWTEKLWGAFFGSSESHPKAYFACYLVLLLVFSIASYLWFEKPVRRMIIQHFKRRTRRRCDN